MPTDELVNLGYRLIFVCMFFVVFMAAVLFVVIKIKEFLLWRAYKKVHGKGGLNDSNSDKSGW